MHEIYKFNNFGSSINNDEQLRLFEQLQIRPCNKRWQQNIHLQAGISLTFTNRKTLSNCINN